MADQRLINANELIKNYGKYDIKVFVDSTQTVLTIPENPTNGDMIMALFPNASITEHEGGATIAVAHTYKFNSTWWNSPYKREEKVEPNIDDIREVTDYSAYPVSEPCKKAENDPVIEAIKENNAKVDERPEIDFSGVKYDIDRPQGEWLPMKVSSGRDSWKCSVCGRRARGKLNNLPFCHCGAKMKGSAE